MMLDGATSENQKATIKDKQDRQSERETQNNKPQGEDKSGTQTGKQKPQPEIASRNSKVENQPEIGTYKNNQQGQDKKESNNSKSQEEAEIASWNGKQEQQATRASKNHKIQKQDEQTSDNGNQEGKPEMTSRNTQPKGQVEIATPIDAEAGIDIFSRYDTRKPTLDDTHRKQTYQIRLETIKRLEQLYERLNRPRGFKREFVNDAIELHLNRLEKLLNISD